MPDETPDEIPNDIPDEMAISARRFAKSAVASSTVVGPATGASMCSLRDDSPASVPTAACAAWMAESITDSPDSAMRVHDRSRSFNKARSLQRATARLAILQHTGVKSRPTSGGG